MPARPRVLFAPVCWRRPLGGSDVHLSTLARQLAESGRACVEIVSTAPTGMAPRTVRDEGVQVQEFPAVLPTRTAYGLRRAASFFPFAEAALEGVGWRPPGLASPALLRHLRQESGTFTAIVTGPYESEFARDIVRTVPRQSVLLACLHDEPPARLPRARRTMHAAAVRIFNTQPERELAERLYGPAAAGPLVGIGITPPAEMATEEEIRHLFQLSGDYLVYVGRQTAGKRIPQLISLLEGYNQRHRERPLTLVLAGDGLYRAPAHPWIRQTGWVDARVKFALLRYALGNITLSRLESLSLTLLEHDQPRSHGQGTEPCARPAGPACDHGGHAAAPRRPAEAVAGHTLP